MRRIRIKESKTHPFSRFKKVLRQRYGHDKLIYDSWFNSIYVLALSYQHFIRNERDEKRKISYLVESGGKGENFPANSFLNVLAIDYFTCLYDFVKLVRVYDEKRMTIYCPILTAIYPLIIQFMKVLEETKNPNYFELNMMMWERINGPFYSITHYISFDRALRVGHYADPVDGIEIFTDDKVWIKYKIGVDHVKIAHEIEHLLTQ